MIELEKFKCVQCGACCRWEGPVRVTDSEIDAIAAYLKIDVEEFIERYTVLAPDRRCLSLIEQPGGACFFYDVSSRHCRINPVKPKQCSDFPYKWNFKGWENLCKGAADMKKDIEKSSRSMS